MSFAGEVKADLCEQFVKKPCCRKALLLGILRASYLFLDREIRFTTRSRAAAQLTETLLAELFDIHVPFSYEEGTEGSCQLVLMDEDAEKITACFAQKPSGFRAAIPEEIDRCPHCRVHYLRGVFLSAGTVTDPASSYHLDMVLSEDEMAEDFGYFLEDMDIRVKHTARKGLPVLYFKESEAIEDFLTVIGAKRGAFSVMNAKILKEVRNNANRVSNCELANIDKIVSAATIQYEAIQRLYEEDRFGLLPGELQETARLRYEHPDLPLKDLAALHEPPLTKSGLNHRLRKIVDFVEKT
ncbi:MAG: DNA-binding protein WhiA [Clostridia bacterium]|nr:DNA-binding protein WhiA [Clostridia bacterium]